MLLVFGSSEEVLVRRVLARCSRNGMTTVVSDGADLCAGRLALMTEACSGREYVRVGRQTIPVDRIKGILIRMLPAWWHFAHLTAEGGQSHEMLAGWYSLLESLPCPVVNRFGLSWWIQDAGYSEQLRLHLSARLLSNRVRERSADLSAETGLGSAYVAGKEIIAAGWEGGAAAAVLSRHHSAVEEWQAESGITFARLTFECGPRPKLVSVEPMPSLEGEDGAVTDKIAAAICRLVCRKSADGRREVFI